MTARTHTLVLSLLVCALAPAPLHAADKLKALIVDGQNNHDWKRCTPVLKWALEDSGRFTVEVSTTPPPLPAAPPKLKAPQASDAKGKYDDALAKWREERPRLEQTNAAQWKQWRPRFRDYAVVVCNYTGDRWPDEVRRDFVQYVRDGGGLVIVHAADNAFPDWPEYNEMIGVGGWGGRNEKSGPMVRWREGKIIFDHTPGPGGTHGPQHEFVVETRAPEHPIMRGLPPRWRHATDELYSKLRGPATNLTVLATAYAAPDKGGTGEHEPMLMAIDFGKGRVFHTALGHGPAAMAGLGFQLTLQRGAEWAATGKVTLPPPRPETLPADKAALRSPGL
jgi:type 1 glutamine amidotransferase